MSDSKKEILKLSSDMYMQGAMDFRKSLLESLGRFPENTNVAEIISFIEKLEVETSI